MTNRRSRSAIAAGLLGVLLVLLPASEARGAHGWQWPVTGSVITPYSNDAAHPYAAGLHRGIDVAAPVGTTVRAARSGAVSYAGALGYSGLVVAVRTVDGYVTSYLHLSAVSVHRGEVVDGGSRLGAVGTTGRRSNPVPHLHFGVRIASSERRYVDPLSLLPPLPGASSAVPAAPVPVAVPVAPRPAYAPVHLRVPVRLRPAPATTTDWGRPLALAGLGLLLLTLFARAAVRSLRNANSALADRLYGGLVRIARWPLRAIGHARVHGRHRSEY
jgi:hypothetical protein